MRLNAKTFVNRVFTVLNGEKTVIDFHANKRAIATNGKEVLTLNNLSYSDFTRGLRAKKIDYTVNTLLNVRGAF